jgi:alkaline phosphatase
LTGNHENTEVGKFLRDYLEVDVDAITRELIDNSAQWDTYSASGEKVSWMGAKPAAGQRLDGQDHLDHYQGDFKKYKMV